MCNYPGCLKYPRDAKTGKCASHGGGYRCVSCQLFFVANGGKCYVCRSGSEKQLRHEEILKDRLTGWNLHWSSHNSTLPCAPNSCKKRPDFVYFTDERVIVLECDEDYHRYYEVSCEISRIGVLKDQLKLPMLLVRFNPDSADFDTLERVLRENLVGGSFNLAINEFGIHVMYIGYPDRRIQELNDHAEDLLGMPFPTTAL